MVKVRPQQCLLAVLWAKPDDQRFPPETDAQVAVQQEADPTEQLFFFDVLLACQGLTDASGQRFVVGHASHLRSLILDSRLVDGYRRFRYQVHRVARRQKWHLLEAHLHDDLCDGYLDLLFQFLDGLLVHWSVFPQIALLWCLLLLNEPLDGSDQADNPASTDDLHFDTDHPSPFGLQLLAVSELATAAWTGPEGFRLSAFRLPFPHGISNSTLPSQLL